MRQVAVVTAVNLAAIAAATLILHQPHPREAIERIQREHQKLVLQNARIEQMLAAALNQRPTREASELRASTNTTQVPVVTAANTIGHDLSPAERATHDELVRAGNEMVDRRIASGVAMMSDFRSLAEATRGLSAAERVQIMARLSAAMNANQVRLERSIESPSIETP